MCRDPSRPPGGHPDLEHYSPGFWEATLFVAWCNHLIAGKMTEDVEMEPSGTFVISSECLFASQLSSLVTLQHTYGMWRGLINMYKKWRQYWYILGGLTDTSFFWVGRFEMVVYTCVKWHQRLVLSVKCHRDNFVCPGEDGLSLLNLDQCLQYGVWRVYIKEFCYGNASYLDISFLSIVNSFVQKLLLKDTELLQFGHVIWPVSWYCSFICYHWCIVVFMSYLYAMV
jgi:hypothetical protein